MTYVLKIGAPVVGFDCTTRPNASSWSPGSSRRYRPAGRSSRSPGQPATTAPTSKTGVPSVATSLAVAGSSSVILIGGQALARSMPVPSGLTVTGRQPERSVPGASQPGSSRRASWSSPPYQCERVAGPCVARQSAPVVKRSEVPSA